MKKLANTALIAALIASGLGAAIVATPTAALSASLAECNSPGVDSSDWNFDMMASKLRESGVSYDSIDTFANCFLVRTTDSDGVVTNLLYDAVTLHRVK